jgi:hypothetical protein
VSWTSRARRNVFDISPGQVPSLRGEPQMTSARVGDVALRCAAWARSIRSCAASQSTERS